MVECRLEHPDTNQWMVKAEFWQKSVGNGCTFC